jgi:hypothetical protein
MECPKTTEVVLDQYLLEPEESVNEVKIDSLNYLVEEHGRPEAIKVRSKWEAGILEDFCGKLDIRLVHSDGLSGIDSFATEFMKGPLREF